MAFLDALSSMLSITLLASVGFALTRRSWITPGIEQFLPTLLMKVVLPPYLAATVCTHFQREQFLGLIIGSAIPAAGIVLTFALILALAHLLRVDALHRRLTAVMACLSNTIFIGLPVNVALFGEKGLPYLLLYYFANTGLQWTLGTFSICGEAESGARRPPLGAVLRRVVSPPLLGMLTGVGMILLDIPMPKVLLATCRYLGGMCTPLALIYVGAMLARVRWAGAGRDVKDVAVGMFGRVLVCPVVTLLLLAPFDLPLLMKQAFVIQAGLPVIANITVMSAYFGADRRFASIFVAVSTVAGMGTVPVWAAILERIL